VRGEVLGKLAIVLALVMFGAIMFSLFLPLGPTTPPILVGATSIFAVVILVIGLLTSS
jgi:hypothetical protein